MLRNDPALKDIQLNWTVDIGGRAQDLDLPVRLLSMVAPLRHSRRLNSFGYGPLVRAPYPRQPRFASASVTLRAKRPLRIKGFRGLEPGLEWSGLGDGLPIWNF